MPRKFAQRTDAEGWAPVKDRLAAGPPPGVVGVYQFALANGSGMDIIYNGRSESDMRSRYLAHTRNCRGGNPVVQAAFARAPDQQYFRYAETSCPCEAEAALLLDFEEQHGRMPIGNGKPQYHADVMVPACAYNIEWAGATANSSRRDALEGHNSYGGRQPAKGAYVFEITRIFGSLRLW